MNAPSKCKILHLIVALALMLVGQILESSLKCIMSTRGNFLHSSKLWNKPEMYVSDLQSESHQVMCVMKLGTVAEQIRYGEHDPRGMKNERGTSDIPQQSLGLYRFKACASV